MAERVRGCRAATSISESTCHDVTRRAIREVMLVVQPGARSGRIGSAAQW